MVQSYVLPWFQSTSPREGRRIRITRLRMRFNPRPHTRGDSPHGLPLWLCSVSIHAPTRGATAIPEFDRLGNEVSIHAPARGATYARIPGKSRTICFNPRPRAGGDQALPPPKLTRQSFNPRPRAGGDFFTLQTFCNFFVSIHAPARGAT